MIRMPASRHRYKESGILACLLGTVLWSAAWAQRIAPQTMNFEQARVTLERASDALAAADASVRGKADLAAATQSLRLPEVSMDVREMQFQKSLDLPLGSLALVERAQAAYEYDVALARLLEISGQLDHYQDYFRRADKVLQP